PHATRAALSPSTSEAPAISSGDIGPIQGCGAHMASPGPETEYDEINATPQAPKVREFDISVRKSIFNYWFINVG
ncbi:MAG: hypothetical protein ACJA1L_003262, partial [Paracoccaceae bacterium]